LKSTLNPEFELYPAIFLPHAAICIKVYCRAYVSLRHQVSFSEIVGMRLVFFVLKVVPVQRAVIQYSALRGDPTNIILGKRNTTGHQAYK
jgi:hypothetical protein